LEQHLPAPVDDYLHEVSRRLQSGLGPDLLAVYATGSIALGAFDPASSDIDVGAVCHATVPEAARAALVEQLRHRALPCPARGLELVLYPATGNAADDTPEFLLELNDGPDMAFHVALSPTERNTAEGTFWYVIDRSIARAHAVPLFGPHPAQVFPEPPRDAIRRALINSVRWHLSAAETRNSVLNACRAWCWAATGTWRSKPAAADWVLSQRDEPVVAATLAGFPTTRMGEKDFLQQVLQELQRPHG
jgi:hypothetical protein